MFLYLHVPFCVSRCIYCDFYVTLHKYGGQDAYVDAVCREIELRFAGQVGLSPAPIQTLYVGGGTPSLLSAAQYARILAVLKRHAPFAPDAEVTLEANPGAAQSEMADDPARYLEAGFNRVSVGVQSLQDGELKKLSRVHSAGEAIAFVQRLQQAGWRNISVDLMYGTPCQTLDAWRDTLRRVIDLKVQHVSMYGLKVEENTPLERLIALPAARSAYPLPAEDTLVAMYFEGLARLGEAGFARYEFSNLAQAGYASRHNLNYWENGDYLALGVAAHGYWRGVRYETVRDLTAYLQNPLMGETHPCPPEEALENAIIFGLRKAAGIDLDALDRRYGIDFRARYARVLSKYQGEYLQLNGNRLALTDRAIPVSNAILAEFLR